MLCNVYFAGAFLFPSLFCHISHFAPLDTSTDVHNRGHCPLSLWNGFTSLMCSEANLGTMPDRNSLLQVLITSLQATGAM